MDLSVRFRFDKLAYFPRTWEYFRVEVLFFHLTKEWTVACKVESYLLISSREVQNLPNFEFRQKSYLGEKTAQAVKNIASFFQLGRFFFFFWIVFLWRASIKNASLIAVVSCRLRFVTVMTGTN